MMPAAAPSRFPSRPSRFADACYLALRVTGWLAVTLACVAALWLLFFVMLGDFSFVGTVLQLENFASRYVAADGARQDRFRLMFWLASAGLFVLIAFFRRHSLGRAAANIPHSKEPPHGR
ncbi:MAG: hypothetical protein LKG22_00240 [Sphingobium sp.]|jgi:hypothetical protein|uniref:hypothetical protein n=1 Tax=Sphingopyxis sp. TaxID=1908224 RepID=UPI0025FAAF18|nr:hypothetical protein [Sphingopyxis sp.]MBK6414148.1 hypothetical protein [Sphingopyxis sp.]MCI1270061.1 hypothetical protein [Sphingobium sp.]